MVRITYNFGSWTLTRKHSVRNLVSLQVINQVLKSSFSSSVLISLIEVFSISQPSHRMTSSTIIFSQDRFHKSKLQSPRRHLINLEEEHFGDIRAGERSERREKRRTDSLGESRIQCTSVKVQRNYSLLACNKVASTSTKVYKTTNSFPV